MAGGKKNALRTSTLLREKPVMIRDLLIPLSGRKGITRVMTCRSATGIAARYGHTVPFRYAGQQELTHCRPYLQFTPHLCQELLHHPGKIPRNEPIFTCCDGGYKGSLAASILAQHHYHQVTNVLGGMMAWKQAGFRIEH